MRIRYLNIVVLLLLIGGTVSAQVRIRIFAGLSPESAVFSVDAGEYEINTFSGSSATIKQGELVVISKYNNKLAFKVHNREGIICDSVLFRGRTGKDRFLLRIIGKSPVRQEYSGDLQCIPDFGALMFVNISDTESYIAGVVKAEGGSGRNSEYFKTQAVIVRTYLYRYMNKHAADHFNLCDNTHCQVFKGITEDSLIIKAALETSGEVILGPDSLPVIAAFHSNCGGETVPSESVWITPQDYLRTVIDPYCLNSRNAKWRKTVSLNDWLGYLNRSGYKGNPDEHPGLNLLQEHRKYEYKTGSFSMPLRQMRNDLDLRSTFFSVTVNGDSVILDGRGYGHGVGLCQEGAMVMASKGFTYRQIIDFYYSGVRIGAMLPSEFVNKSVKP